MAEEEASLVALEKLKAENAAMEKEIMAMTKKSMAGTASAKPVGMSTGSIQVIKFGSVASANEAGVDNGSSWCPPQVRALAMPSAASGARPPARPLLTLSASTRDVAAVLAPHRARRLLHLIEQQQRCSSEQPAVEEDGGWREDHLLRSRVARVRRRSGGDAGWPRCLAAADPPGGA